MKRKKWLALIMAILVLISVVFADVNLEKAEAAGDMDAPVLERVTFTHCGEVGKANDHKLEVEIQAYDADSGIDYVWLRYFYTDVTDPSGTVIDKDGYAFEHDFSESRRIYRPFTSVVKDPSVPSGKNYIFKAEIELNDFPDAGNVIIDEIRIVDKSGNEYNSRRDTGVKGSFYNNNISYPFPLNNYKYVQSFGSQIVTNSNVTVNSIEYRTLPVTLTTTRTDITWGIDNAGTFAGDTPVPTYESDAYIDAMVELDFSNARSGYSIGIQDIAMVFEDKNVPYVFHFAGAGTNTGYPTSVNVLQFETSTFVVSELQSSSQESASCAPKSIIIRWTDGREERVGVTGVSQNQFNMTNWHVGVDGKNGTLSNVKYEVNGSPYDLNDVNTRDLHYGEVVTVYADIQSFVSDSRVTFRFDSYYGQAIYVDAEQVSGNTYKAELELKADMNPTLWHLSNAYIRRNTKNLTDQVDINTGNKSFLIRLSDDSVQLPIMTAEYNISNWDLPSFENYNGENAVYWGKYRFNFTPELSTTDDLLAALNNQRPIGTTPSELTFTGWKVEKLIFAENPDGSSYVANRELINEDTDMPISSRDFFEISALYDNKSIYNVSYNYVTKEDGYGSSRLHGLGSVDDLKDLVKDINTDIDGVTIADWKVTKILSDSERYDLGELSKLTELPVPSDNYRIMSLDLEPVYSKPINIVEYYYYDFTSPEYVLKQRSEWMANSSGDGSDIADALTARYADSFPAELGFTGYRVREINEQPVGDVYVLEPVTDNKILYVFTDEYVNGNMASQSVKEAHIIAEADIAAYVESLKDTVTPIANGETFAEFETYIVPPTDVWSDLITLVELRAKYEGKIVLETAYNLDSVTGYRLGNGAIMVDEGLTEAEILSTLKSSSELSYLSTELGVTDWKTVTGSVDVSNFGYFVVEPVSRTKKYLIYELNGGEVVEVKGVDADDPIMLPATMGPVKDIYWESMRIKGEIDPEFVWDEFTFYPLDRNIDNVPMQIVDDTVIYGFGIIDQPSTPPQNDSGNSNNSQNSTENKEEQKTPDPVIPVPAPTQRPTPAPAQTEVPDTRTTVTQTQEIEHSVESPVEEESKEEQVEEPKKIEAYNTKSGEKIEIEVVNEKTKEVLDKVIENSETINQKKAEKLVEELGKMPEESESTAIVAVNDEGKTVVTEQVKVGTDAIEINDKGEVQLTKDAVNDVKTSIQEALKQTEAVMNSDPSATVETPQVVLDMGAATVVSEEIFKEISGKNVDVVIKKDGYYWTINGNDISASRPISINLEVDFDTSAVPEGLVKDLAGSKPTTQLSLAHNGDFGLKAKLTVELGDLGKQNVGQYGNLYYYDSDGKLVFQNAGVINPDGTVSLDFSHASDYVVIIGPEETPKARKVYTFTYGFVVAILAVGAALFVTLRRKKVEE